MLASLRPERQDGIYAFVSVPHDYSLNGIAFVGCIRETEGCSLIVTEEEALRAKLPILFRAAWITLAVNSDLAAVGLTAVVSKALADRQIACNVVAGAHHDHLFVPVDQAEAALSCLSAIRPPGLS